jgi:hypothetical protein
MDPIQKRELKRQAWMRLAAQQRRAGLLRGRVVALSVICFLVLWGIVFAQMATGNDPVLSSKAKTSSGAVATTKKEVETTDPRELEFERRTDSAPATEEEAFEEEPELEEEFVEEPEQEEFIGPEFEGEAVEAEPEFEEAEPEFEEPLVTSQS